MGVDVHSCNEPLEYYNSQHGCSSCDPCIKGTGIKMTQKIERSARGMQFCYSCYDCPTGTYQDEIAVKSCRQCTECKNRQINKNCTFTEDTNCGDCWPGYTIRLKNGSYICEEWENNAIVPWVLFSLAIVIICILGYILKKVSGKKKKNLKEDNSEACECNEENMGKMLEDPKKINPKDKNCFQNMKGNITKVLKINKNENKEVPLNVVENQKAFDGKPLLKPQYNTEESQQDEWKNYKAVDKTNFSLNIGKQWRTIANVLHFSQAEIDEIENSEELLHDRAFRMVNKYEEKYCLEINEDLTRALFKIKRNDLLIKRQIFPQSDPEVNL